VIREWGQVGARRGRIKEDWHAPEAEAAIALAKALKRRVGRGYRTSGTVLALRCSSCLTEIACD
jgi:hypothetical protein